MELPAETPQDPPIASRLLAEASAALAAAGVSTARLDAEVLLATACGVERTVLYMRATQPVTWTAQETFRVLLARRLRREPLQYIVGRQEFWSLDFLVTPDVLIPRPETELLVELAVALLPPLAKGDQGGFHALPTDAKGVNAPLSICDLGTGSGCLAVALAREFPNAEIWAIDQSAAALEVARQNARRHGIETIRCVAGDLFAPIAAARFDLIVCNPPYIATDLLDQLQPELAWEPRAALDGGADGLAVIRRVIAAAPDHLIAGGWLLMEIGADQAAAVSDLARAARLDGVSVRSDYAGLPRVLLARR